MMKFLQYFRLLNLVQINKGQLVKRSILLLIPIMLIRENFMHGSFTFDSNLMIVIAAIAMHNYINKIEGDEPSYFSSAPITPKRKVLYNILAGILTAIIGFLILVGFMLVLLGIVSLFKGVDFVYDPTPPTESIQSGLYDILFTSIIFFAVLTLGYVKSNKKWFIGYLSLIIGTSVLNIALLSLLNNKITYRGALLDSFQNINNSYLILGIIFIFTVVFAYLMIKIMLKKVKR